MLQPEAGRNMALTPGHRARIERLLADLSDLDAVVIPDNRGYNQRALRKRSLLALAHNAGVVQRPWTSGPGGAQRHDPRTAWLDSDLFDFITSKKLCGSSARVLVLPFYRVQLADQVGGHGEASALTAEYAVNVGFRRVLCIFDYDLIAWPVNYGNSHWYVVVYDVVAATYQAFDPDPSNVPQDRREAATRVMHDWLLGEYNECQARLRGKRPPQVPRQPSQFQFKRGQLLVESYCGKQTNSADCGPLAISALVLCSESSADGDVHDAIMQASPDHGLRVAWAIVNEELDRIEADRARQVRAASFFRRVAGEHDACVHAYRQHPVNRPFPMLLYACLSMPHLSPLAVSLQSPRVQGELILARPLVTCFGRN